MFRTRSDTNWPVQSWKKARSMKFEIKKKRHCFICGEKMKALILLHSLSVALFLNMQKSGLWHGSSEDKRILALLLVKNTSLLVME